MREESSSGSNVKVNICDRFSKTGIYDFTLKTISPYSQVCYKFPGAFRTIIQHPIRIRAVHSHDNQLNVHFRPNKVPQSQHPSFSSQPLNPSSHIPPTRTSARPAPHPPSSLLPPHTHRLPNPQSLLHTPRHSLPAILCGEAKALLSVVHIFRHSAHSAGTTSSLGGTNESTLLFRP